MSDYIFNAKGPIWSPPSTCSTDSILRPVWHIYECDGSGGSLGPPNQTVRSYDLVPEVQHIILDLMEQRNSLNEELREARRSEEINKLLARLEELGYDG